MKKIISLFAALLVAAGAMTVTSCATSHDDLEAVAIPGYIVGGFGTAKDISASDSTPVGDNKFYAIKFTDGLAEFSFTQVDDRWTSDCNPNSMTFQITLDAGWDTGWKGKDLILNDDYVELEVGKPANSSVKGLVPGNKYKISVKMEGSKVSVKVTGEATASKATDADVSALNSETAKQKGAYFRIGGDNFGNVSAQQVLFNNGSATGYITVPKNAKNGWGKPDTDPFELYAFFGAGDNGSTLNNGEVQVKFPETTLGKAAKISFDGDNLKVTDLKIDKSATKVYRFVVKTTPEGATITVSAVE